jgi:hypothetical protein
MFGFGNFPDKSACNAARDHFIRVNPHFIINQNFCPSGEWRAYIQYIEPESKLGYCILFPSTSDAERSKQRLVAKGIFAVYHALRRGDDAVILNLIDYKPSIEKLLSNNIYAQLMIAICAENWFSQEFLRYDREDFSQRAPIIDKVYSDYLVFLSRKCMPEKKEKIVGWEGGVYSWHALAQALIKNNIIFQSKLHDPYKNLAEMEYDGDRINLIFNYVKESLIQYGVSVSYNTGENSNFLGRVLKASVLPFSGKSIKNPQYRYWLYSKIHRYTDAIFCQTDSRHNYPLYQARCDSCHQRISPHEIDALIELGEIGPFETCHECAYEIRREALSKREKMLGEIGLKSDDEGGSGIFEVIKSGDCIDLILMLSKNPELVNSVNHDGWMPIHVLAAQGEDTSRVHLEMARELLRFGADANSLSPLGWMPVHLIAINGAVESVPMAKLLFQNGADVSATTGDGVSDWKLLWQHGQEVYDLFETQSSYLLRSR